MGGLALIGALVAFVAGPFAPVVPVEAGLGDLIVGISKEIARSTAGLEPPPAEARPWDADRILAAAIAVMGVLAVVLAVVAYIRKEPRRVVIGGVTLNLGAVTLQFLAVAFLMILGLVLILGVLHALGLDGLIQG